MEEMGLQGKVTPLQAKKKWDNLKKKYKDCKYPGSGEGVSGKPTAASWPWFVQMDEVLGQRPSIRPPVLISSIPEDTPQPSAAVGDQEVEEEVADADSQPGPSQGRKRKGRDELVDLIKEDMRYQREAEERRAQENRERMDRLESQVVLLDLDGLPQLGPWCPLMGRHLCTQLVPPRGTTDASNTSSPSSSATSSTISASGAMMSPAPMQILCITAHAVMT
ncbi:hypothetical protein F7725_013560 [Dissostichus mawsoni]|uniref:Myb/SANT-like DNA-binding domain-containing protein n=1 Tax=Dissostichus mawsoni TaxID=36200 RepID=A0A7J5Y679_DISMA|nr:hypothetical protein F7725_013560 [Dissostichus mawsoni]